MVDLGRVDIVVEMSHISSLLAIPHKGHMASALKIMSYLRIKHNSRLVLDPSYSDIEISELKSDDNWTAFYGDSEEAKPHNAPKLLSKEIDPIMFVYSNHSEDKTNFRSCTGYMIFMNMSMIDWNTKKQATVKGDIIGSEFVSMKQGVEVLRGMRYKW